MSLIQGLGALNVYDLRKAQPYMAAEQPRIERQSFVQSSIAPKYSLTFPKADNSVPSGESHLGQKLPRLYA